MAEYLVRNIMIPLDKYPHVPRTCTLRDAITEMDRYQLMCGDKSGMARVVLVFSENLQELVGLVRRRDILRGLEPRFLVAKPSEHPRKLFDVQIDPNLTEISFERMITGLQKRAERLVSDVMVPVRGTLDHEDHLMKAVNEMVNLDTSLLPVLREGKVVGVVRSVDVLHRINQIISEHPSA